MSGDSFTGLRSSPARLVALIDGEHHPPLVRVAIETLRQQGHQVAAAVFCGGTEKASATALEELLGLPVIHGPDPEEGLLQALEDYRPQAVVDLSDEPVLSARLRFRLAARALLNDVRYVGADFELRPAPMESILTKASIRVIATGKRTGKTAVAGALARHAVSRGISPVVVAMGRGGPDPPAVIEAEEALDAEKLLRLADQGGHAASDYIEDAVTSRVATIGCWRVAGGLAGGVFISNVGEAARIAEGRAEELVLVEGSGAAIPPVRTAAGLICVPALDDPDHVTGHLGPYRLLLSDVAVVTMAEVLGEADATESAIREVAPHLEVIRTRFRPKPLADVSGRRVFFCSTAPAHAGRTLRDHLEDVYGCDVVGISNELSDRTALRRRLESAPEFDVLVTELKAGAVDVAVRAAVALGREVVFADNELVGEGMEGVFDRLLDLAKSQPDEGRQPHKG